MIISSVHSSVLDSMVRGGTGRQAPLDTAVFSPATIPANALGPTTATTAENIADQPPTHDSIQHTLDKLNDSMQAWATGLQFEIDEDSEQLVVKLVDRSTGDVIRQVPSEATLKVARMISELRGSTINIHA